jgi:hypothetical protein
VRFYIVDQRHTLPRAEYPAAILYRDNWDDYGFKTTFTLSIALDRNRFIEVGAVKILHTEQSEGFTPMPEEPFVALSDEYCSLGQSLSYYQTLKQLGVTHYSAVLSGLRDVVLNTTILDQFVGHRGFRESLERFGSSARAISDAAPLFRSSTQPDAGQRLTFRFTTSVGGSPFLVPFSFNDTPGIPGRMNALIGYNGTGKTRLLANLALVAHADLRERAKEEFIRSSGAFLDAHPRFSSVIAVSYSAFDTFEVPGGDEEEQEQLDQRGEVFGYVYTGLRSFGEAGSMIANQLKSISEIADDFQAALSLTKLPSRQPALREAISQVLSEPSFLRLGVDLDSLYQREFMSQTFPKLSTGHKIVLNIIVQLGAHLAPQSLVLIDEPESHLHPPLLAALLRGINMMLYTYDSFAVLATHSPVVLQEIPRRYVFILRRFGTVTTIEKPDGETFGENVGFLTRNVFNLDSSATDFHAILRELARIYSVEEIERLFGNPMSAQARAYVEGIQRTLG